MAAWVLAQRYELLEPLGSGAMATVWRAHDRRLSREVAIKVLSEQLASNQSFRDRFEREAVNVASLKHPNVVTVYDSGSEGAAYYIIMELVEGESLQARLTESSPYLSLREVSELGKELLAGLAHAHAKGIIHRDIKPANILITQEGTAKLADFGIARAASDVQSITATGSFIGTPSYSSPEQLGSRPATPTTDLYSLGCVLYHCLAGHPPFEAELPVGVIAQHLETAPPPLRQQRPEVPPGLEAVVLRALEKDPEQRFSSADEMSRSLLAAGGVADNGSTGSLSTIVKAADDSGAAEEISQSAAPGRRLPAALGGRRRRLAFVLIAAVVVAVAVGLSVTFLSRSGGSTSVSSGRSTTGSTTAATTATTAGASTTSAASAALQPLLGQWQTAVTSGPVNSSQGLIAVIAHDTTSVSSTATVYGFSGGRWNVLSSQDLGFNLMAGTPIVSGTVTGGPDPDFLIQQEEASQAAGSVLSSRSGTWQIVPFRTSAGVVNQVQDLHFSDGHPVSQTNTCTPSCAAGNQEAVSFNYDPASRQFVQQP
ncbi:MAG TPA: serine/threonine-protein kinase [Acidimicrobiales bacterium]|jgi:serine/threonine-protein kinase